MEELKRSYYLPLKLVKVFTQECSRSGYIKQSAIAAALLLFLDSSPNERSKMFERLDKFQKSKK
jgi:hypothetical protein